MSFRKILFRYDPPATIAPAPAAEDPNARPASRASTTSPLPESRAAALIKRLDSLKQTAAYLEELIVARTRDTVVPVNYNIHPEAAASFLRLYRLETPPPSLSIEDYNSLLDSEAALTRTDMALAATGDGSVEVNPLQRADLMQISGIVENTLSDQSSFEPQLALMLRDLKGDRIAFDAWIDGLRQYPAVSGSGAAPPVPDLFPSDDALFSQPEENPDFPVRIDDPEVNVPDTELQFDPNTGRFLGPADSTEIPSTPEIVQNPTEPGPIDIAPAPAREIERRLSLWENYYSHTYNLATQVDEAYFKINEYANRFLYQPISQLLYIVGLLRSLIFLFHKPSLKSLVKAAFGAFLIPRLMGEVGKFFMLVDRVAAKLIDPAQRFLDSLQRTAGTIQRVGNDIFWLLDGGLTGLILEQATGRTIDPKTGKKYVPPKKNLDELAKVPQMLGKITGYIRWSLRSLNSQHRKLQEKFYKMMDRRLGNRGDRLEILDSMRQLNALLQVLNQLILEKRGGRNGLTATTETFGRVLSSLNGPVLFAANANGVRGSIPNLPAPSATVADTLTRGGANTANTPQEFSWES